MKPTVLTINKENVYQYIVKYIETAASKGAYTLEDADVLKQCFDTVLHNAQDNGFPLNNAKGLLTQALVKGQAHGSYTITDSSVILHCIKVMNAEELPSLPQPSSLSSHNGIEPDFDLSELAKEVPL